MRQILMNSAGAIVARMPRPMVQSGHVLIKLHYSAISAGTETASLRGAGAGTKGIEKVEIYSSLFKQYFKKALRNPKLAVRRIRDIARSNLSRMLFSPQLTREIVENTLKITEWHKNNAKHLNFKEGVVEVETDDTAWGYQVCSNPFQVTPHSTLMIELNGVVNKGKICIGLLNHDKTKWLSAQSIYNEKIDDNLVFELEETEPVYIVITNSEEGSSHFVLNTLKLKEIPNGLHGQPYSELKQTGWNIGYSAVGEVVANGEGVVEFLPGDIVACAGAGYANHAEYVSVPKNLVCRVPKNCNKQVAAMTTLGAIALQGVRRANPTLGETIAVMGLGLLGQITVQLLRANGCYVIGLDIEADRLQRAINLGMEAGSIETELFKKLIHEHTQGVGVDRTIITASTRSDTVANLAMEVTRRKGTVVIVGDIGMKFERTHFYQKEIDLLMSTSYGPGRYDAKYEQEGQDYPYAYVRWTQNRNMKAFLDLVSHNRLQLEKLIDKVVSLDEVQKAYLELAKGVGPMPLGVLIEYPKDTHVFPFEQKNVISPRGHRKARKELINYIMVGVGAFGTAMLVPQLQRIKDRFFLLGVVSRDAVRGSNYARTNRLEVLATDLTEVLEDERVNLLVIATRHKEHAMQAALGLRAGKHVFVEKPLALNWQELEMLIRVREEVGEEGPLLMVGFNRRFSPAMQLLRDRLKNRRSPLMINYRLNGGYISKDHWIQTAMGGGRNLGEACHMYDCFRFLTGSPVTSVQASSIRPGDLPYLRNDNFSVTLTYEDGSLATLMYSALGPKEGLPKERVEVFCDGEAYVIDDYKALIHAGNRVPLWESNEADKGHYAQLCALGEAIAKGTEAPIPFSELIETSAIAIHIEELIAGGVIECNEKQLSTVI